MYSVFAKISGTPEVEMKDDHIDQNRNTEKSNKFIVFKITIQQQYR